MANLPCRAESERQILRLLVQGEKEIAEGRGIDLDTVLAEADELLGFFCGVGSGRSTIERKTSRSVIDILPQHVNNLRGSGKDDGEVVQQPSW